MTPSARTLHRGAAACFVLVVSVGASAAQEAFRYAPPGVFPSGSGRLNDRTLYLPDLGFPLQAGLAFNGAHAFANSQIHPQFGSANDKRNYVYPWHDTYCETRSWDMPLCPGKTGHQGVDIQPASPDNKKWPALAMDDGVVTGITKNTTLTIRSDANYSCRYLHLDFDSIAAAGLQVGSRVRRGDVVGKVSNILGRKPQTSIHLHFDCFRTIDGKTVRLPVYTSLISAYRKAWGLDAMNAGNQLGVDAQREVGAQVAGSDTPSVAPPGTADPAADLSLPKSIRTRNFGAITPQTEMTNWPDYLKRWPGLRSDVEIRDSFGKIIPAFRTDEDGVGVWWYWMVNRAGFGAEGQVTFEQIALKYAGTTDVAHPAVVNYISDYSGTAASPGLSKLYFNRFVDRSEKLSLSNPETRWMVASTMFHHEAGRKPPVDRITFDRGIALATTLLQNGFGPGAPATEPLPTNPTAPVAGGGAPTMCTPGAPTAGMELTVGRYSLRLANSVDTGTLTRVLDILEQRH